jgi:4-amino-4-deoxychorismate lyase
MSRFIESIRWEGGRYHLLSFHAARMERTLQECLGVRADFRLEEMLPDPPAGSSVLKCRVLYGRDLFETEWIPYERTIHTGHLVVRDDRLEYPYKYADRACIERHVSSAPDSHDVILVRNGLVTDASYSNLVFFDGRRWLTPAGPLLPGVMRAFLLDQGAIAEAEISLQDLHRYPVFRKINALNPWESAPVYLVKSIR